MALIDKETIRAEILRFFADASLRENCLLAIGREKKRLGWDTFCNHLTEFAATL